MLVDQLRADRLEVYGASPSVAPELDEMAQAGFYFEEARSAAPWTYPSVCSLLTGLYPRVHQGNRRMTELGQSWITRLPDAAQTLAESLGSAGYGTAGFVANPYLKPESNFGQGFDHYEHDFVRDWEMDPERPNNWWQSSSYAGSLNDRVRSFLDGRTDAAPAFLYVHYIDVHGPWDNAPFDVTGMTEREKYDTATRYASKMIGELFEATNRRFDGNLLFIVAADHGRALEPGDESADLMRVNKQSLHDFNLRVPLVFAATDAFPYRGRSRVPVSLVDVAPTVLALVDLPSPAVDGVDLSPLFQGGAIDRKWLAAEVEEREDSLSSRAIISDRVKFLQVSRPRETYFEYDLRRDPDELAGPLVELDEKEVEMQRELDSRFEEMDQRALRSTVAPMDAEMRDRLRSLGYIH